MCYIIIRYLNECFAEQSNLLSSLFTLIFSLETTILEKREERIEKSEENKRTTKRCITGGKNDQKYAKMYVITGNISYIPAPLLIL